MLLTDENKIITFKHTIWVVPDSNGIAWRAWQYLIHFTALSVSSVLTEFYSILEFYGFSAISTGYFFYLPLVILIIETLVITCIISFLESKLISC